MTKDPAQGSQDTGRQQEVVVGGRLAVEGGLQEGEGTPHHTLWEVSTESDADSHKDNTGKG